MNKIISLRQEKGLTLKELADILGVSEATVSRWENGKKRYKRKKFKKTFCFF
jgi:transcriptional regulator with XRE-family HTH domain